MKQHNRSTPPPPAAAAIMMSDLGGGAVGDHQRYVNSMHTHMDMPEVDTAISAVVDSPVQSKTVKFSVVKMNATFAA
jgi:3-dehydroquinate synthetase